MIRALERLGIGGDTEIKRAQDTMVKYNDRDIHSKIYIRNIPSPTCPTLHAATDISRLGIIC